MTTPAATRWSASRPNSSLLRTAVPTSSPRRPNSGGYDVDSDLMPGQTPLAAYPQARRLAALLDRLGRDPGDRRQPDQPRARPLRRDPWGTAGRRSTSASLRRGWRTEGRSARRCSAPTGARRVRLRRAETSATRASRDGSTNVPLRGADGTPRQGHGGHAQPRRRPRRRGPQTDLRRRLSLRLRRRKEVRGSRQRRQRLDLRARPVQRA